MPSLEDINSCFQTLSELCLKDSRRLSDEYKKLTVHYPRLHNDDKVQQWWKQYQKARDRINLRLQAVPSSISIPTHLPVFESEQDICNAIQNNQVVIIAGETGSGKTTQIPKLCLKLGFGIKGFIGHTQPRRLATRAVSNRIAEELNVELGKQVGYKVRFRDDVTDNTLIKLMTDGVLLAEMQTDPLLLQYDTIIIDEAHERSLNIDFILGYLKKIMNKRPALKIIITSATIDVDRFSTHFNNAPVINVSGRTFPVEIRYRPFDEIDAEDDNNDYQAIINAVDELSQDSFGDILVFLTGEKEIRDVSESLTKQHYKNTDIIGLYARLSAAEQNKIFQSHSGRRIILSTNVAETSLTVPGIKYVIDNGKVRMSRYSYRTKVQRLPIEPISQASANQRAGRCGRVSNGICIRLYSQDDYLGRPVFTEPEILRTNLAAVILQMLSLNLGDISQFPFIEAPEYKYISDGLRLLHELGAINYSKNNHHYQLTKMGRQIAQFPIDPKLARMLLEAKKRGCITEIMIIVAALSIQDVRERPTEKQQAADQMHRLFYDKQSDFMFYILLWNHIEQEYADKSYNQLRQFCKKHFLNYLRVREWQDLYAQIRQVVKGLKINMNQIQSDYDAVHISLLSGLLSNIGVKELERHTYLGARNIKFAIFPNSALFKSNPKWCMSNELVETTKLWGRCVAGINPDWIEPIALHLVKSSISSPYWSKKRGSAQALEKVTLFGLPIVIDRKVQLSKHDQKLSHELFILHALIYGEWNKKYAFFVHNKSLIDEIEALEHKTRRQDILVEEHIIVDFYQSRIPCHITSVVEFDLWWNQESKNNPTLLNLSKHDLIKTDMSQIDENLFPDEWIYEDIRLNINYQFDIGQKHDGASIQIPIEILNQIKNPHVFEWQVPGFRKELIIALIKSLPKSHRRHFVPAPNYADAFLNRVQSFDVPLIPTLIYEFKKMSGISLTEDDFNLSLIPEHLILSFHVINHQNKIIKSGNNLIQLKNNLDQEVKTTLETIKIKQAEFEIKKGIKTWDFGILKSSIEHKDQNYTIISYPTLIDQINSVSIELVSSKEQQQKEMKKGVSRLIFLSMPQVIDYLNTKISSHSVLKLSISPLGSMDNLINDLILACINHLLCIHKVENIATAEKFAQAVNIIRADINKTALDSFVIIEKILQLNLKLSKNFKQKVYFSLAYVILDMQKQLSELIYPNFITQSKINKLNDIYRYLQAIERRFERFSIDANRDRANMLMIQKITERYNALKNKTNLMAISDDELILVRWMIEELRVSLFAQQLGTAYPISDKRINKKLTELESVAH